MNFWREFKKAGKYPKLTATKLWPLIHRAKAGDADAFEEIIKRNSRLVYPEVEKWLDTAQKYKIDPMDLVQSGLIGLVQGTLSFNPRKGRGYLTYVKQAIASYIQKEFYANTPFSRREGKRRVKEGLSLNPTESLCKVIYDDGEEDSLTLEETLGTPDESSLIHRKIIIDEIVGYLQQAKAEVHQLSAKVIPYRYSVGLWHNKLPLNLAQLQSKLKKRISKKKLREIEIKSLLWFRRKFHPEIERKPVRG